MLQGGSDCIQIRQVWYRGQPFAKLTPWYLRLVRLWVVMRSHQAPAPFSLCLPIPAANPVPPINRRDHWRQQISSYPSRAGCRNMQVALVPSNLLIVAHPEVALAVTALTDSAAAAAALVDLRMKKREVGRRCCSAARTGLMKAVKS